MTPASPTQLAGLAETLTEAQREAISGAIFLAESWVLTTEWDGNPEIEEDLSEDIACPVSGILTPLGEALRSHIQDRS